MDLFTQIVSAILATMSDVIELLSDAFYNIGAELPSSFYEAEKTVRKMGLDYIKIDACLYDCMLFWGPDATLDKCRRCGTARYKVEGEGHNKKKRRRAIKSMRYFPLRPRLQRLFMSPKIAEQMRWHVTEANPDGKMRHPRDGDAWKAFDGAFPDFASEPRNVRLDLASDGFNPFVSFNQHYSV